MSQNAIAGRNGLSPYHAPRVPHERESDASGAERRAVLPSVATSGRLRRGIGPMASLFPSLQSYIAGCTAA